MNNGNALKEKSSHPPRIRLLKVLTTYFKGGTEGQVLNLMRCLDRGKFDLYSSCLRKGGDLLEEFESLDIPISEFRIRKLYDPRTFLQQFRFAQHLRSNRIQIVHSYNFYANVFAVPAARMARTPVVLASIRDRGVYLTPAQRRVQKWACQLADQVLVNADSIGQWLVDQGYEEDKITVIKNGIDTSLYANRKPDGSLRREFGIPDTAPIVIMIARLNPQKGFEEFIQAAARINRTHPEVYFLVIGANLRYAGTGFAYDNRYRDELREMARELGVTERIVFAGHRTDVPDILAESTISVLPSHSEGLSNSLLESMAAGVPTVATDAGGNSELVKDNVNGLLIPLKSPEHLAQACRTILDDPELAQRFSRQAKSMAQEQFSMAKMTADTQALYLEQLHRKKHAQQPEHRAFFSRSSR